MSSRKRQIPTWLNVVLYQLCWLGCVLGAAYEAEFLALLVVLTVTVFHLSRLSNWQSELRFISAAMLLGTLLDTIPFYMCAFSFPNESLSPWSYPLWMSALWLSFACTLRHSLHWLMLRPMIALVFGFLGGPLSYFAGMKLEAITFPGLFTPASLAVAITWALAMLLLVWLFRKFEPSEQSVAQ